jgi:hypothetical protein
VICSSQDHLRTGTHDLNHPDLTGAKKTPTPSEPKSDQTLVLRVGLLHLTSAIVYPLIIVVANGNPPISWVFKDNQEH